ncbi:MAG: hypothetical protein FWE93_07505 [Alphaproteobacteria bacterium]|nr:hypothetical protein [Alphaproteobacteria bacterium]
MANYSGGSGYMPLFAMFAFFASFPATLFIWTGMATSSKTEDGALDYQILKRRINRTVLPSCLVLFVICVIVFVPMVLSYSGNLLAYGLEILWCAAVPTIGMYCTLFLSAKLLNTGNKLTKGKWLLLTLGFSALLVVLGIVVMMLLDAFCGSLNSLLR